MKFAIVTVRVPDPLADVHHQALQPVEVALSGALRALGHDVILAHGPFEASEGRCPIYLNAPMLGFHVTPPVTPVPENAILYNWEAFESPLVQNMLPMFKARRVWDGFQENIASWRAEGVQAELVPFGWVPELEVVDHRTDEVVYHKGMPLAPSDIDILFCGSVNDRRRNVLREVQRLHGGDPARLVFMTPSSPAYGEHLSILLSRAKVVLNPRFDDAYPTPTVRPLYAIANGCLVVTEPGHFGFRGGRIDAPVDDLAEEAVFWARQPARVRSAVSELGMVRFHEVKMKELVRHAVAELESV